MNMSEYGVSGLIQTIPSFQAAGIYHVYVLISDVLTWLETSKNMLPFHWS